MSRRVACRTSWNFSARSSVMCVSVWVAGIIMTRKAAGCLKSRGLGPDACRRLIQQANIAQKYVWLQCVA